MDSYNRLSEESMMSNEISLQRYPSSVGSSAESSYPSSYPPVSEGYLKLNHTRSDPMSSPYSMGPTPRRQYPSRMGEPPYRSQSTDGTLSSSPRGGLSRSPPRHLDDMDYLEPMSTLQKREKRASAGRMPLHDSGVDIQDVYPSMNGSPKIHNNNNNNTAPPDMFNYPHTKNNRPESLAVKGHLYEELPTRFGRDKLQPQSQPQPQLQPPPAGYPAPTSQGHSSPGGSSIVLPNRPTFRKRQNPLYEETDGEENDGKNSRTRWLQCPCLCVIITSILVCVTLLLVVLLLLGVFNEEPVMISDPSTGGLTSNDNSIVEELRIANNRISELETQYDALYNMVIALQNNQTSTDTTVSEHTQQISTLSGQISSAENRIQAIEVSLQNTIPGVSVGTVAPGTSGTPSPAATTGNMAGCHHDSSSNGAADSVPYTDTAWIPTDLQMSQERVITGLECSVENGNNTYLVTQTINGFMQFRCRCHGSLGLQSAQRFCILHWWDCPRNS